MKTKTCKIEILNTTMFLALCLVPWSAATAADCASVLRFAAANTTITSASLIPAGGGLPEYCRVQGHIETEIGFEVRLPTNWNGKFYFEGVPGLAGLILPPGPGLARGYAEATTDTGHVGAPPVQQVDGSWALNNPERQTNFGYRAVHTVTLVAKQIVQAFYGRPPQRSYFEGCSNGGRQGLMEAQRYPSDYDGIISASPVLDFTGVITDLNWEAQALGLAAIPASKAAVIDKAALEQCDAADGLKDGLIGDPRRCRFDPRKLQCHAGDGPDCLTEEQVQTVRRIYAGPVNSFGERLYPGMSPGHEDGADGWPLWLSGSGTVPPLAVILQNQVLRFFVFGPNFDPLTLSFDTEPALLAPMGEFMNAVDPDLSAFRANGGKLIIWHGWADPSAAPFRSVEYFQDVVDTLGENTPEFFRLFMAPGVHHCGGGPGPNTFDMLAPLEDWVERGIAPRRIIASHTTGNVTDRTRPLCPYPQEAKYAGRGSIDDASNFVCRSQLDDE